MACIFRWAHFSDIHFQTKKAQFNTKELRDKLPEYLASIDGDFDALIISGDFRYAPDKEENPQKVADYILSLARSLRIEDGKKIVTVPGNHDLERSDLRTIVMRGAQESYNPNTGSIASDVLSSLLNSFTFYNELHNKLADAPVWHADNPHAVVEFENCNLLLLNSALTAGGNDDSGKLILGTSYIQSKLAEIKNSNPTIAVGHHAFEELDQEESKTIAHFLEQRGIKLYLCGHAHDQWFRAFGENCKEVNTGCMMQPDNSVKASFIVGELNDDGTVIITSYKWDFDQKDWFVDPANKREFLSLYPPIDKMVSNPMPKPKIEKVDNPFSIMGYTLLGSLGCDGIKYYWQKNGEYVESIALNKRLRNSNNPSDNSTSAYTISTSLGCQLAAFQHQCRFCETGTRPYIGPLKAEDIALQCIFMAEYDSNCPSYPQVRSNSREFAFMGQGEPGFNYAAIKKAILLTDYVMERLGQNVSRYVISTCGISELIYSLITDIKSGVYKNKVSIHLSLHEIDEMRSEIMPINKLHDYREAIKYCKALYQLTKEKIGVGILMFDQYQPNGGKSYTLTPERLSKILAELDNDVFRIDLCAVNQTSAGKQKHQLSNQSAGILFDVVKQAGFEGKIFTSFGDNQQSGCGMLSSSNEDMETTGSTTISHFNRAVELLHDAESYLISEI